MSLETAAHLAPLDVEYWSMGWYSVKEVSSSLFLASKSLSVS
jgi:hypothetical protein